MAFQQRPLRPPVLSRSLVLAVVLKTSNPISAFLRSLTLPQKTSITEKELLYRLQCPIRSCGQNTVPDESPILTCAERTAQWLVAERFDGRTPSLKETHNRYFAEWDQTAK